ncbi:MAG: hypothetical protein R2731_12290 [Nocardioides sp.]
MGQTSYDSGQRAQLTAGVRDVAHEFSCAFTGADGEHRARGVFAPPVPGAPRASWPGRSATSGCSAPPAAAYGKPSVAAGRSGARASVAFRGRSATPGSAAPWRSPRGRRRPAGARRPGRTVVRRGGDRGRRHRSGRPGDRQLDLRDPVG